MMDHSELLTHGLLPLMEFCEKTGWEQALLILLLSFAEMTIIMECSKAQPRKLQHYAAPSVIQASEFA